MLAGFKNLSVLGIFIIFSNFFSCGVLEANVCEKTSTAVGEAQTETPKWSAFHYQFREKLRTTAKKRVDAFLEDINSGYRSENDFPILSPAAKEEVRKQILLLLESKLDEGVNSVFNQITNLSPEHRAKTVFRPDSLVRSLVDRQTTVVLDRMSLETSKIICETINPEWAAAADKVAVESQERYFRLAILFERNIRRHLRLIHNSDQGYEQELHVILRAVRDEVLSSLPNENIAPVDSSYVAMIIKRLLIGVNSWEKYFSSEILFSGLSTTDVEILKRIAPCTTDILEVTLPTVRKSKILSLEDHPAILLRAMQLIMKHEQQIYGEQRFWDRGGYQYLHRLKELISNVTTFMSAVGPEKVEAYERALDPHSFELLVDASASIVGIVRKKITMVIKREGEVEKSTADKAEMDALLDWIDRLIPNLPQFSKNHSYDLPEKDRESIVSNLTKTIRLNENLLEFKREIPSALVPYRNSLDEIGQKFFDDYVPRYLEGFKRRAEILTSDPIIKKQIYDELVLDIPALIDPGIQNGVKRIKEQSASFKDVLRSQVDYDVENYHSLTPTEIAHLPHAWKSIRESLSEGASYYFDIIFGSILYRINSTSQKNAKDLANEILNAKDGSDFCILLKEIVSAQRAGGNNFYVAAGLAQDYVRWAGQSIQSKDVKAASLTDKPYLKTLSAIQKLQIGMTNDERAHFTLAAPRYSRWIYLRAHWASRGNEELENQLIEKLINVTSAGFIEGVKSVSQLAVRRKLKKEEQTDDQKKISQILTPAKDASNLLPEEVARMDAKDDSGKSLIDDVRNILFAANPRQGAPNVRIYLPYHPRTKFLGLNELDRKQSVENIVLNMIARAVRQYPFDHESARGKNGNDASKSHFTDRVFEMVKSEIYRLSNKDWKDTVKAGTSLDEDVREESGFSLLKSQAAPGVEAKESIASNEFLSSVLDTEYLLADPALLDSNEARAFWIVVNLSENIASNSKKTEIESSGALGGAYSSWVRPALSAMQSISEEPRGYIALRNVDSEQVTKQIARKLIYLTPFEGDPETWRQLAEDFADDLEANERKALLDYFILSRSGEEFIPSAEFRKLERRWLKLVEKNGARTLTDQNSSALLPDFRAPLFVETELRQIRQLFSTGPDIQVATILNKYMRTHFMDVETKLWVSASLTKDAPLLSKALVKGKQDRMTRKLEAFIEGFLAFAKSEGHEIPRPKRWW